ncbi:5-methylcytosine restriction system specificity protein McrC [Bacillus salipaludis]|uniref:5-methylcytosine restriction system specificity protein McrC n=1 Tax=Bacillus salipaludis TaxID=2547811 RepID=UPI002E1D1B15|nr:hypothetical protein [Bacillus salipaludis]
MVLEDNTFLKAEQITVENIEAIKYLLNKKVSELEQRHQDLIIISDEHYPEIKKSEIFKGYLTSKDDMSVSTTNVIGVLEFPNIENEEAKPTLISIGSRFDSSEKQYFLIYLLTHHLAGNVLNLDVPFSQEGIWDLILLFAFVEQMEQVYEKGFFKQYVTKYKEEYTYKGRLNIKRQIERNMPFIGKFSVVQREMTSDNIILWLLRYTTNHIERNYRGLWLNLISERTKLREVMEAIKIATPDYKQQKFHKLLSRCRYPISHPFYQDYEKLRKTCLQILRNEGINPYTPGSGKLSGILFDVAWLWEKFMAKMLQTSVPYAFKNMGLREDESGILVFKNNKTKVYPDFVEAKKQIILDAKYKKWKLKNNSDDIHQILSYMFLTGAKIGGIVYPSQEPKNIKERIIDNGDANIFLEIPYYIPDTQNEAFFMEMADQKEIFVNNLMKNLELNLSTALYKKSKGT